VGVRVEMVEEVDDAAVVVTGSRITVSFFFLLASRTNGCLDVRNSLVAG
jgi:hypothetical protein